MSQAQEQALPWAREAEVAVASPGRSLLYARAPHLPLAVLWHPTRSWPRGAGREAQGVVAPAHAAWVQREQPRLFPARAGPQRV